MGVASYREDDLTRFLEATDTVVGPSGSPTHYCPFCPEIFSERHLLSSHLSSSHQGDRPVLMIDGREPDQTVTIRQPVRAEQILVENCSDARVFHNGARMEGLVLKDVPTLLSREKDAIINLELANFFDNVAIPIWQSYRLVVRIPDKASIDAVDCAFIEHLATSAPRMNHVAAFLQDTRCMGLVSDYADALGCYVRGLLVKDQAIGTGVTLRPAEADNLYGEALERLKSFNRPLATVVCGIVRFAFNDFSQVDQPTGFGRLDRCNGLLAPLSGHNVAFSQGQNEITFGPVIGLCPFDQAVDRILDLAERLNRQTRWGRILLENCQQAAEADTFGARDRAKVLALWAASALRLDAEEAAMVPLRQLRAAYPFAVWAAGQLDRIEE